MLTISIATPERWADALRLLFRSLPDDERAARVEEMLAAGEQGELSLAGLLTADDEAGLAGAVMSVEQGDGTGFVWPARTRPGSGDDTIADALYAAVTRRVAAGDMDSVQAIVEPEAVDDPQALARNGFEHLVDLFYLQRLLARPLPPRAPVRFEITTFSPSHNEERFARLIEQTYVDTLDCPDFHEHRSGLKALASHRCSGEFAAGRWKLYAVDGQDVGLLLMNDHPDQEAWELVYMGVAPAGRGRGYGRAMLLDGLHSAREADRRSVLLAVDAKNHYANAIYGDLGFIEIASRAVYVFH